MNRLPTAPALKSDFLHVSVLPPIRYGMMNFLIADAHNDFLTMCPTPVAYMRDLAPNTIVTAAVFTTELCETLSDVARYAQAIKDDPRFLLSVEDCGVIKPEEVGFLSRLGVVSAGLTWNNANRYGGGAYSEDGLSQEGAAFCQGLDAQGIFVDTAHMNDETFYGVYDLGVKMIDTHTALSACHAHTRAISFDRVGKILQRGGKVGLTLVARFYGGGLEEYAAQVDTFVQHFGVSGLCLGTDFWGTDRFVVEELGNDYKNLSVLVEKLFKMGYNEKDLRKIFADNYLSLWSTPCMSFTTTL